MAFIHLSWHNVSTVSTDLLWWSATQAEGGEDDLDTLVRPRKESVDTLPRVFRRVDERWRNKRTVLGSTWATHKRAVALCNNKHCSDYINPQNY